MQNPKGSALTTDFHLRLSEFQKEQKKILSQQKRHKQQFLYSLQAMPISISPKQSMFYFSLFLFWFLHMVIFYLKKYGQISKNTNLSSIVRMNDVLFQNLVIGYICNGFLLVLSIMIVVLHHLDAKDGCLYIFSQTANRLYPYLRFISKGLFLTSCYFANSSDIPSIALFVFASIFSIFLTVFLQNITLRKDQFCCKSLQFSIIFRLTIIISLSLDLIGANNVSTWSNFLFLSASQLVLSINLLICYFKIGITIYRHICARLSMLVFIITYHSLSLAFCVDIIATQKYSYGNSNIYLISSVIFIVVSIFISSTYCRIRKQSTFQSNQDIKQKIYFMFNKFEQADMDEEIDCQIRGIIHDHYYQDCRNPQCIVNIKQAYDSKKRKMCSIHKIAQGKTSVVKFYVKCLYQTEMLQGNFSKHFELDFLEFFYLKFKNVYQVQRKIVQLQRQYLTFYQRLRLIRLKSHLIQQSNKFSSELFNKSLSMQDVIEHQKRFSKVQSIIQLIICRNELFWKYLQSSQIHLKQILDVIRPNFNLMNILNKQWEFLNHYFHINRRWKFYYICYNIFIKNEKIKPSMIEDFGNSVDYDAIFKSQNYFVDKTTEKQQLFNPIMLFQQNTCFIHTVCDEDKMTITKVSNFFEKNFEYQSKQVINFSISILMAPSIRTAHHKKFLSWIKNQKSNNEAYYQIKKNYPLTKKGYIYPCFKFYKRYIKLNGDIEYISMLKSNKKDEQIILLNKNFQIEAITVCLHHKLKMHGGDYIYLQGISILALIPSLIKYTRFGCDVHEDDQDFFDNHDNIGYLKKQNTYNTQNIGDDKEGNDILTQRKNIGLSNIKFYFPNNLQQGLEIYKKAIFKKKGQVTFEAIKQLYKCLKKSKNYCKFKVQLVIRQRDMQGTIYYQLQINQIEESNRLQKLDFEQQKKENSQQCIRSNDDNNQYNEIDMELFFSLSKKKHKVMLFPSKNIFLKDQHNKALNQIPHINNISFFMRFSLFFLILFVILQISFESNMVDTFSVLTTQFEQIVIHQKTAHMLNNQYSIQHIQPGNYWQQSFIIIAFTHILIKNYESQHFQKIIYDREINFGQICYPLQPMLNNHLLKNIKQEPLDQVSIFFKIYQSAITLHRTAEIDPHNTLQILQYYEFNNYIYSFQKKVTQIKDNIIEQFDTSYNNLRYINIILVIISSTIILCSLIFSFSRLLKVYRGFGELVSILIQIDNSDIKSISRYVDYTKYLFERINNKYYQMGSHAQSNSASSSNFRSFQKKSSELQQEQQKMGSTEANLNKKIKKMQIGSTITKMMFKPSAILLGVILLIGGITLTLNTFAIITLNQYADFQKLGFEFFRNVEINNILATGALQKFRNSSLYDYKKYEKYMDKAIEVQASEFQVRMVDQTSQFERLVKKLYESNFCKELSYILNGTLTDEFADICDFTNAGWCSQIFEALSQKNLIKRCEKIQNGQMEKGLKNYNNFFLGQVIPYFKNQGILTLTNAVELNDAFKNIDYILIKLIQIWRNESINKFQSRNHIIIFISIGIIGLTILLIIILIQFYIINSLKNIYEIFREMHEHYIPEWLINKQKIIKAKLVNEGFMKQ